LPNFEAFEGNKQELENFFSGGLDNLFKKLNT